jgi:hypothetical protein
VYRLGKSAGPLATAAGLSFVAYLIGVLSIAALGMMGRKTAGTVVWLADTRRRGAWPWESAEEDEKRAALQALALNPAGRRYFKAERLIKDRHSQLDQAELFEWGFQFAEDLRLVPFRLMGKEPELYGEHDRLRSEAEFRLTISIPLVLLIYALMLTSLWWALLLPLPFLLFYTGSQQREAADDVLFDAIRAGRVESPVLAELDAELDRRKPTGEKSPGRP